jgi:carbon storage regulator
MLVLSRRRDESIMIGDNVEITVVEVRGDVVKLGVRAPREVPVHRKEIYMTIQEENIAAARASAQDISKALEAVRQKTAAPPKPRDTKAEEPDKN